MEVPPPWQAGQHRSGMTGQQRQGEDPGRGRFYQSLGERCDFKSVLYWTGNILSHSSAEWPLFSSELSTVQLVLDSERPFFTEG